MSRAYKKILSLFGLALVVAITVIATGVPPVQQGGVSAKQNDVLVAFEIESDVGAALIAAPSYGTVFYDGNSNAAVFDYAQPRRDFILQEQVVCDVCPSYLREHRIKYIGPVETGGKRVCAIGPAQGVCRILARVLMPDALDKQVYELVFHILIGIESQLKHPEDRRLCIVLQYAAALVLWRRILRSQRPDA